MGQMSGRTGHKVFVIGLDGATFDVMIPLIQQGRLQNIAALMQQGGWGRLRSTIHPLTPPAWTTFMTGKNPGKHGVFDFIEVIPGSYNIRFVNGSFRRADSLWSILSQNNKKVGVINVPFTYPPERVNGFLISGLDTPGPDSTFTHPPGLYREILEKVGGYDLRETWPIGKRLHEYKIEDLDRVIGNKTAVTKYLMTHYPWDFLMMVYGSPDQVQHLFWRYMEDQNKGIEDDQTKRFGPIIPYTYVRIDQAIGELLKESDEKTIVMILSDHGGGKIKRVIDLNSWLASQGYLAYRKKSSVEVLVGTVRPFFKRYVPRRYRDWLKAMFPQFKDRAESQLYFAGIDWEKTRAYSWGMYGNISINLTGREPRGAVRPGREYEAVCAKITEKLYRLEDPFDHSRLVEKVYRKEDIFSGPFLDKAPDLLIVWKDYAYYTQGNLRNKGSIFQDSLYIDSSEFEHSGTHRLEGVFIASGGVIKKGLEVKGTTIVDLAPTILYLMGLPIPMDMDGRVVQEIIEEDYWKNHPPQWVDRKAKLDPPAQDFHDYAGHEVEAMRERLKGLGYL
jgi:predicted AlkP superfamily phosphohydrolase/phosphomutase